MTDVVIVKQDGLFQLCLDDGDIEPSSDQGLYFHDMRHLSAETLRLDGRKLVSILADASEGHEAHFELTNSARIAVRRQKCLGKDYTQHIGIENYTATDAEVTLDLHFEADFADMFVVRGMHPGKRGTLRPPRWRRSSLIFRYDGADGHQRSTTLHFSRTPRTHKGGDLTFHFSLKAHSQWQLTIRCDLRDRQAGRLESTPGTHGGAQAGDRDRARAGSLGLGTQVDTSNPLFNEIITRSFLDLHMLSMRQKNERFFAAGVPWYVALFGRDSLITSIQMAAFEPQVGANTLRVLAGYQGKTVDDWRDEQPGKILHELRVDELANLHEIPQTPYYGSVDSTPLFLILLGVHSAWTGRLDLFRELRENVTGALAWINQYADSDGDGFIDYQTHSPRGGRNQGWKDSANGVVMEDGTLAEPPVAMPEVQGDVYLAWLYMADLFERDGDGLTAQTLRYKAEDLYRRFNREFWLSDARYYAFCRQQGGRFSTSIASNAAHALWTGIVDPRRAHAVVQRVLEPDMFSGWGIRTLAATDHSYNPVDYQLGSVWPHDNAFIAAGMQRYDFVREADRVLTALMQAAAQFEHFRLPEVFAGYDRGVASRPVKYPVACNPQAWAAGSMPFMLAACLGLEPDAFNHRLRIRRPHLPVWLDWVRLRRLTVGDAQLELLYERSDDKTLVAVTRKRGNVLVSVEP